MIKKAKVAVIANPYGGKTMTVYLNTRGILVLSLDNYKIDFKGLNVLRGNMIVYYEENLSETLYFITYFEDCGSSK